jgi:hypothetical protein
VLRKTVELVSHDDIAQRRADFHEVMAKFHATGLRDETIVGEIEDLLAALNASIKSRTNAQRSRAVLQIAETTGEAAALWAPPIALATGPTSRDRRSTYKPALGSDRSTSGQCSQPAGASATCFKRLIMSPDNDPVVSAPSPPGHGESSSGLRASTSSPTSDAADPASVFNSRR